MLPNHFVIFWDNKPIAIDQDSGGYPYKLPDNSNPSTVKYFRTREDAQKYWDILTRVDSKFIYSNYFIKEIQFRIMGNN